MVHCSKTRVRERAYLNLYFLHYANSHRNSVCCRYPLIRPLLSKFYTPYPCQVLFHCYAFIWCLIPPFGGAILSPRENFQHFSRVKTYRFMIPRSVATGSLEKCIQRTSTCTYHANSTAKMKGFLPIPPPALPTCTEHTAQPKKRIYKLLICTPFILRPSYHRPRSPFLPAIPFSHIHLTQRFPSCIILLIGQTVFNQSYIAVTRLRNAQGNWLVVLPVQCKSVQSSNIPQGARSLFFVFSKYYMGICYVKRRNQRHLRFSTM